MMSRSSVKRMATFTSLLEVLGIANALQKVEAEKKEGNALDWEYEVAVIDIIQR